MLSYVFFYNMSHDRCRGFLTVPRLCPLNYVFVLLHGFCRKFGHYAESSSETHHTKRAYQIGETNNLLKEVLIQSMQILKPAVWTQTIAMKVTSIFDQHLK